MGENTKNLLIGMFVVSACALIIWFILFLKPSVGDGKKIYHVRFSNINKINVGSRVTFAGKPVGEVIAIREIYHARDNLAVDKLDRIYFFELVLKVDSSVQIYNTDEVALQTSGLLGERSVAIIPMEPPKGVTPKLITDQPIYAESVDPIENAFVELSELANNMEETFKDVNTWIQKYGDDLGQVINSFGAVLESTNVVIKKIDQENLVGEAKEAISHFSTLMDNANQTLQQLHDEQVFANVGQVLSNMKAATTSMDAITQDIAAGKGTLGRLVKGDDLYLRFTAVMSKIDTLMNDINHYGVLFHLNKGWQRERTKQITTLNALDTPQGFKNYFEKEVDQINVSMARLSLLLEKAQEESQRDEIMQSTPFKQDFAELLRLTQELSDNMRLYNEQLESSTP